MPPVYTHQDGTPGRVDRLCEVLSTGPPPVLRRPARRAGIALGPPQGPDGRDDGVRGARGVGDATPTSCSPGRACIPSPTTRRAPRCWTRSSRPGGSFRTRVAVASISRACRWPTSRRTRRSSTRSSATRRSSCRRASWRASVSRSRRPCGSRGPSSRARWAASRTRSRTASPGCCSTTRTTSTRSARRRSPCCVTPRLARRLGERAREVVRRQFLANRHALQYIKLFGSILERR